MRQLTDRTDAPARNRTEEQWVVACRVTDVSDDFGTKVELADGRPIAIFRVDDRYYATNDRCTHGEASLSEGLVTGRTIECPFHFGTFDIITGKALTFPCVTALTTYPVRIEGDQILVDINPPAADQPTQAA